MTRVLIVGASLGALRTAEALRDQGFAASITVVGAEPHLPYDRPSLSKTVMTGASRLAGTALPLRSDLEVDWRLGRTAVSLDLQRRLVALADGAELAFDGLVLATGARARIPGAWAGVCGVHVLRGRDDARALRVALRDRPRRVAVLGAGFIGSEIAASIRALDVPVTLLDGATLPLAAAVGDRVAQYVVAQHRAHGVDLRTESTVVELELTNNALVGLRLADGTLIDADLAVVGFGVTPNTEWLENSGLVLGDGIVCDAQLRTRTSAGPLPGVVAVGDVARWPHPLAGGGTVRIEHWSNAIAHGALAARTLLRDLGDETTHSPARDMVPSFWTDLYATKILAVGLPALATASTVLSGSLEDGHGVVGYGRDGRLVGAVAINDPRGLAPYRRLLAAGSAWPPEPTTGSNASAPIRSNERTNHGNTQRSSREHPPGRHPGRPGAGTGCPQGRRFRAAPDQGTNPPARPRRVALRRTGPPRRLPVSVRTVADQAVLRRQSPAHRVQRNRARRGREAGRVTGCVHVRVLTCRHQDRRVAAWSTHHQQSEATLTEYLGVISMLVLGVLGVAAVYLTNRAATLFPTVLVSQPFLSGWDPEEHALSRYHARWYPATLLFLAFDVEMLFMYPWALVVAEDGLVAVVEMFLFLGVLLVAVVWAWREGALRWV